MKLLIIGGTRFVGRHLAEEAVARDHEVTLFHRGHTAKGSIPAEEILGDRDGEVDKLAGRQWDAAIDTCGFLPRIVEQSAYQLQDQVGRYCFVSTISVYQESLQELLTETSALLRFAGERPKEEVTGDTYGPFKVLCEEAVQGVFGDPSSLIIRPGLIVGPHDSTDRFTYWIDRFGRSEPVLLPDRFSQPVQFIDARDLAEFVLRQIEQAVSGVFNVTGPANPITMGDVWKSCREHCGGRPEEVVVDDEFLEKHGVEAWKDLPFVTPKGEGLLLADTAKARSAGLAFRDLDTTVRDTSAWHRASGETELKAGMPRNRELELIDAWRSQG